MKKLFFIQLALVLLLAGCVGQKSGGKYIEVVLQDPYCGQGTCFHEIILLEDGLAFVKEKKAGQDYTVSFCSAGEGKVMEQFSFLDAKFRQSSLIDCDGCAKYHLFYNDGNSSKYSVAPVSGQSLEDEIYANAKNICSGESNAKFIHVIFGGGKGYFDYHVFSNNTVVFERFGLREGELLESRVSMITAQEFNELEALIPSDFFSSADRENCPANGYAYGFVEAFVDGNYAYRFTCGGDSAGGRLFLDLVKRLSP